MTRPLLDRLRPETRRSIRSVADRCERELLEMARIVRPDDFELLVRLGELYSRLGCLADGLRVDRRLVRLAPRDPIVRYNFACSLALAGELDAACEALAESVRLGYSDLDHLMRDPDLAAVRQHGRFEEILKTLRRRARRWSGEI